MQPVTALQTSVAGRLMFDWPLKPTPQPFEKFLRRQSLQQCTQGAVCAAVLALMQLITPLSLCRWAKGNVVLLGDSAHAMQPNLGQGGCMAIEDGFQLAKDLARRNEEASGAWFDVEKILVVGMMS